MKLILLVLVPAFSLLLRDARERVRFGAGVALGLTPFLPLVIFVRDEFYDNAIAYRPRSQLFWGIHLLLCSRFDFLWGGSWLRSIDAEYARDGRYVIMAASLGLGAWARRSRRSAVELAALVFAMFLFLAPEIGVQYLVILVPVLVMTDLRRAAIWGLVAGLFVSAVYMNYHYEWFPFRSIHRGPIHGTILSMGFLAWLLLLEFMWSRLGLRPRASPVPETDGGERSRATAA